MKKKVKKLELSKETLKKLEPENLKEVHGGICRTGGAVSCDSEGC